ncbi:hypothetical protein BDV28DRAFT_143627 [Aspergillus coremiiformis]|uniref:Uncharacterized protein n=1 Tax=Aspergillus coremiiformis TaxID=138285 RepID=A0A5N6YS91_9EURO|nr:hypothetical protein BDV28DRAFT_143627 [Aspergillus coremiiformis]
MTLVSTVSPLDTSYIYYIVPASASLSIHMHVISSHPLPHSFSTLCAWFTSCSATATPWGCARVIVIAFWCNQELPSLDLTGQSTQHVLE